ncbi:MAG: tRNA (guanosine(46)-N7)-methyltransferase TrmB [Rhodospirillaceae bacterium]|nr:tRNA (guanosine(46)-N7)-methyltransferase TrmB [Rhodospirillaceae bacterium]
MFTPDLPPEARDPHFFGRRKGKALRPGRVRLMETLLPAIAVPEGDAPIDPLPLFSKPVSDLWLEIGFGGGEHLAGQAATHPDVGIIGCEVFLNGVARLLSLIHETPAEETVRLCHGDVRLLMPRLPAASLDRAFVLFPDPWPKTRHAKRRFIGPDNLPALARLLKDGAELRVASDDMTYIRWALMHLMDHPDFMWMANTPDDWLGRPADWVPTRYEKKALVQGRVPVVLRFARRPRG